VLPADYVNTFLAQDSLWISNLLPPQNKSTEDTIFVVWIQYGCIITFVERFAWGVFFQPQLNCVLKEELACPFILGI
jgi:hypothetical protein